ncbi:hypothetical protein ACS0TY_021586 [Phlomoides rotata]
MMSSPNQQDVNLPEPVEQSIKRICIDKNQPPLKIYARKMLAEIGQQASVEILDTIISSKTPIKSFSGFVSSLVKTNYPVQADTVLSALPPTPALWSPSSSSPHKPNGENLLSPLSSFPVNNCSSNLQRKSFQNISRQLSFEDETSEQMASPTSISPQLLVLNKLEYRKLFLVLSYIGREKFEAVVSLDDANEIYDKKDLCMKDFETAIWNKYGRSFCKSDRSQYLDWDSGKTHLYYSHICQDGTCYFKGPYLNSPITHLQRSLHDDNILIVKFENGAYDPRKFLEEGIFVGLRQYRFFVFKDERKKAKKNQTEDKKDTIKCYFVHTDPHGHNQHYILSRKSISEARLMFMHIHTLQTIEKYMARFSLILSKTMKLEVDFAAVIVEIIEDIPFQDENGSIIHDEDGKPILHTDGTGYISEDLAMKCPDFYGGKYASGSSSEPLLMQCRLFHDGYAVKGTLLVNRKLAPGTIQIRPSMIKVGKDQSQKLQMNESFNSLEIVTTSKRPQRNILSKYLIALLSYGGVPQEFFLNLLTNALEETRIVYSSRRAALKVASNHDGLQYGYIAQRMISCGLPLNEPYLQLCLSELVGGEKNKLKQGKITISESFYLMGTADPTGELNNNEVCVILDCGQISGKVLVYRNPGMHFGDIHIMEAVYVKRLEEFVGNAKYGIFFSTKGQSSAAYEMATGDFDGDRYWVSRNPELLKHFKASEPWKQVHSVEDSKKRDPREFSDLQLERELFNLFLEARTPSPSMGIAADSWLTLMDRLLTLGDDRATEKDSLKKKMLMLVDLYYEALDAPKSGKKVQVDEKLRPEMCPHHMEKNPDFSYHSSSILGQIYDRVHAYKDEAVLNTEIWNLPCFDIQIDGTYMSMWRARYGDYRKEMSSALGCGEESKDEAANEVINKYKKLLYGAAENEESAKNTGVIYDEAIAIYRVTYEYAMTHGVGKCGFAWKVAGTALCNLCARQSAGPNGMPFTIVPSVLRDLLN